VGRSKETNEEELRFFVLSLIARTGINPDRYTYGELITIANEADYETQVDRACSAQSSDMLPKRPTTPQEMQAKKAAIAAHINSQFEKFQ
jgi:hypothetical protein